MAVRLYHARWNRAGSGSERGSCCGSVRRALCPADAGFAPSGMPTGPQADDAEILQDFGCGFCCVTEKFTAVERAVKYHRQATITIFDIDEAVLKNYTVHRFPDTPCGIGEWALFVAYNRGWFGEQYIDTDGHIQDPRKIFPRVFDYFNGLARSDIIIRHIADDRMQEAFAGFMNNSIGLDALTGCLKAANLGTQYMFKTLRARGILNYASSAKTMRFTDFLDSDPQLRNITVGQIIRGKEIKYQDMRTQIKIINRRFWESAERTNFEQALFMLEEHLKNRQQH